MTELEELVASSERLRPRTKIIYLEAVKSFVEAAGSHFSRWTPAAAIKWYQAMLGSDIKAATANIRLAGLKYASKRYAQINQNPSFDFAMPVERRANEQPPHRRALTDAEAQKLLLACEGSRPADLRDKALITLGLGTGMRRMELAGVTFEGFGSDPKTGVPYIKVLQKGGKHHPVPLDNEILVVLGVWMAWLRKAASIKTGAVFRSLSREYLDRTISVGDGMTPDAIYKIVLARAKKAGIEGGVHPHIFRHTFVTWCQDAGLPATAIAAVTGHVTDGTPLGGMIGHYTDMATQGAKATSAVISRLKRHPADETDR
jgi:integrase